MSSPRTFVERVAERVNMTPGDVLLILSAIKAEPMHPSMPIGGWRAAAAVKLNADPTADNPVRVAAGFVGIIDAALAEHASVGAGRRKAKAAAALPGFRS